MGFSGSHIPGHSGTDFKNRKAFVRKKEYYRKQIVSQKNKTNQQEEVKYNIKNTKKFKPTKAELFIKYGFGLPALIIASLGMFYGIFYYSNILSDAYNNNPHQYAREVKKRNLKLKAVKEEAYQVNVGTGLYYFQDNKLEAAQIEYTRALSIDKYGKTARIGLAKVLLKQCQQEGIHCQEVAQQLAFIRDMNFLSQEEIEKLKNQFNYSSKNQRQNKKRKNN